MVVQGRARCFRGFRIVHCPAIIFFLRRPHRRRFQPQGRSARAAGSVAPAKGDGCMLSGSAFRAVALISLLLVTFGTAASPVPREQTPTPSAGSANSFYCPMHPDFRSDRQGKCPRCGMTLRSGSPAAHQESSAPKPAGTDITQASLDIPDVAVYDQDGKKLSFYSDLVKDRTVAINFIFTTCTTICPPLTATMSSVQQQLGSGAGIQLISITVDPATDVPARLKSFAEKFGARPGWAFVTGSKADIDRLLKALGAYAADPASHSPMVLIGNEHARYWIRSYGLASPSALKRLITEAAARSAAPNPSAASSTHKD